MSELTMRVLAKAGVDPGFIEDLKQRVNEACAKAELEEPHE
jgi:hypothetical protein